MTPVRVALRLSPPLVADLLAHLVEVPGLDVVIDLSSGAVEAGTDVLVTASPLPAPLPPTVVVLSEPIAPGTARIQTGDRNEEVVVGDLAAIAEVVRRLCGARG